VPSAIAIDGPVAAGKTAVGRLLSRRLGYRFLDTGTMYRAVTWLALERGIDVEDEEALARLAREAVIEVSQEGQRDTVQVNGRDITQVIRRPEVEQNVSLVARLPRVRRALVEKQRAIADGGSIVMAGRDIGTVVLPDAGLKVFLLASVEERARRRYLELRGMGQDVAYEEVLRELKMRDKLDSERSHSPLRPAPDAHLIDTDGVDVEQVVERILALMGEAQCPSSTG
jgi:cytidylate kinase